MNGFGAVIAGLVGTLAMSLVMAMAPSMGLPKMDIVGMLGSMLQSDGNRLLGWGIHLMMGAVPAMHAGVKAGTVQAPGVYMLNTGGLMAFIGGLIGHLVFGLIVALVYGLIV